MNYSSNAICKNASEHVSDRIQVGRECAFMTTGRPSSANRMTLTSNLPDKTQVPSLPAADSPSSHVYQSPFLLDRAETETSKQWRKAATTALTNPSKLTGKDPSIVQTRNSLAISPRRFRHLAMLGRFAKIRTGGKAFPRSDGSQCVRPPSSGLHLSLWHFNNAFDAYRTRTCPVRKYWGERSEYFRRRRLSRKSINELCACYQLKLRGDVLVLVVRGWHIWFFVLLADCCANFYVSDKLLV